VLFALLAVAHTWPLASAPGRLSRHDNADAQLNEWIVAWVAHAAPRQPARLFDAPIFHPDRGALAYSEPLIAPGLLGAPLAWLGASPVLVYNVLVLAGLTLSAWAAAVLVARWTGDLPAGAIGGAIVAFNAHTLTRIPQLQALHVEFFPLALLAFDVVLTGRRRRAWIALAAAVVLQGLTSLYGLVFTIVALGVGALARVEDWRPATLRRSLPLLAASTLAAAALLAPALAPYRRIGQVRALEEVGLYSATWRAYLMTPARLHYDAWSARFFAGETALFPGVAALVLAAIAIVSGTAVRDRRARMAIAFGIAGLALSFGPRLPGYETLYTLVWPLQGIRNAARFGVLAIDAAAILAGFGVAWIRRRYCGARWLPVATAGLFLAVNLDAFSAPLSYVDAGTPSPLHAGLRGTSAVVAEFPFYPPERMDRQAPYLAHAMLHWRPMVNGYSGVVPASYIEITGDLAAFPAPRAMERLRRLGVTHVFVHDRALRDWTDDATADSVGQCSELERLAADGELTLYRLR
jgi:hypothetical protein